MYSYVLFCSLFLLDVQQFILVSITKHYFLSHSKILYGLLNSILRTVNAQTQGDAKYAFLPIVNILYASEIKVTKRYKKRLINQSRPVNIFVCINFRLIIQHSWFIFLLLPVPENIILYHYYNIFDCRVNSQKSKS